MKEIPPFLLFVFGLVVGSFLNVCIHRLPRDRSIVSPPSACPSCGARLAWYDNVPVVSYLALRGRCRSCRKRISPRYPLVEIATALLFVALGRSFPNDWTIVLPLFYASSMLVVTFTDLDLRIIPDSITLPGIALGLAHRGWIGGEWLDSALGILLGGGSLWLLGEGYFRLRKREGMGGGDVKLAAMMGAFLGWASTFLVLFAASLAGGLFGTALILLRRGRATTPIPFGVFLAPIGLFGLVYGERVLAWYLGLAG